MRSTLPRARWRWLAVFGALLLVLAACGDDGDKKEGASGDAGTPASEPAAAKTEAKDPVAIAFLPLIQANPYIQATLEGIKDVAGKENATVQVFDGALDGAKQESQCRDVLTSGKFKAIITVPVNPTNLTACFEDAISQGIVIVNTDFPVGPDAASGQPQIEGQAASVLDPAAIRGQWIFDLIKGACEGINPCKASLITGILADPYGQAVNTVVTANAKKTPNVKIVAVREGLYLPDTTLPVAKDILQANPDLNVIATISDPMTVGAEQAVKDAGRDGKVKLIGGGLSSAAPDAIRQGRWYGTFLSLPFNEGQLGAQFAIRAARGEKVREGVSAVAQSGLPAVITKDTIDKLGDLKPQWQGL